MTHVTAAASAPGARGRTSCKRQVSGSIPLTGSQLSRESAVGRLLREASEGRTPESGATVAKLMDGYAAVAEWGVSTRQANEGFIRRTFKPGLGLMKVRKALAQQMERGQVTVEQGLRRCQPSILAGG